MRLILLLPILILPLCFCCHEAKKEARSEQPTAKSVAKRHKDKMVVGPLSADDVNNMRVCLKLKVEQHPELRDRLLATGDAEIIEDCSKRKRGSGLFWGAALEEGVWEGANMLGKLWMELRDEARCSQRMAA